MTAKQILLAGVIGSPVGHSLSPALHAHWLKRHKIKGYYIPIEMTPETFEDGLRSLSRLGFRGVNITLPFKKTVLDLADTMTDRAALIGAANTVTFRKNGRIHADNTDGFGFIENLMQHAPDWQAKAGPAVVLGAGGAARAVVFALLDAGAPEVILSNRTRNRAEILKEHFGARIKVVELSQVGSVLETASLLVNTTSLGMTGAEKLPVSLKRLTAKTLVTDLVYSPLRTVFLEAAEQIGCQTVDGLGMLLHQAVPGFESWFRKKPVVDDDLRQAVLRR